MATMNDFHSWAMGFAHKKEKFDEPWASSGAFPANRMVYVDGKKMTLTRNMVAAMHEICSGSHYIGIKDSCVYVEYHSSRPGDVEVVCFDIDTAALKAAVVYIGGDDEAPSFSPMYFTSAGAGKKKSSGKSMFIVLLFGILMRHGRDGTGLTEVTEILDSMKKIVPVVGTADEVDFKEDFARYGNWVYNITNPAGTSSAWIGRALRGVDVGSATIDRLSEVELSCLEGVTPIQEHPLMKALLGSALDSCQFLSYEDTHFFSGTKGEVSAACTTDRDLLRACFSDEDAEARLVKLREELELDRHPLSDEEKRMVPTLDKHYVVDFNLLKAARIVKDDWKYPGLGLAPNLILEGDAGSGKTAASKFFASVFNMPYTKMTMHPTFESANLIGAFYPVFSDDGEVRVSSEDKLVLDKLMKLMPSYVDKRDTPKTPRDIICEWRDSFDANSAAIDEALGIPTEWECRRDPADAWKRLGCADDVPDIDEVVEVSRQEATKRRLYYLGILCDQVGSDNVRYKFILSEIIRACQNGWLCEIQEAASILRPGVLTELNSLLEPGGRLELPNGQIVYRHPDTIIVFTTNRGYAGNMDLNESLRDRCMLGLKMDTPTADTMAERVAGALQLENAELALKAAKTIKAVEEEAKSKNIRGSFGFRSLEGWVRSLMKGDFSEDTLKMRVINKMTTDADDVATLMACVRNNCPFASKLTTGKERRV